MDEVVSRSSAAALSAAHPRHLRAHAQLIAAADHMGGGGAEDKERRGGGGGEKIWIREKKEYEKDKNDSLDPCA